MIALSTSIFFIASVFIVNSANGNYAQSEVKMEPLFPKELEKLEPHFGNGNENNKKRVSRSVRVDKTSTKRCPRSATKVIDPVTGKSRQVCAGELLIDDKFDQLNNTLWRTVERFTSAPDYGFVAYRNDEQNVNVVGGFLEITPTQMVVEYDEDFIHTGNLTLQRCTEQSGSNACWRVARGAYILPPFFSGLVDTKNNFAFTYGKIRIRASLPRGDWSYPILALEILDPVENGSTYPQLRVASSTGNTVLRGPDGVDISGYVLCSGPTESIAKIGRAVNLQKLERNACQKLTVDGENSGILWSDHYHDFELEWRRDRIISRVDGIEYVTTPTRPPFDKPFYLNIGVGVGGHDEFPDTSIGDGYLKPWRNFAAKAALDFWNSADTWSRSWENDRTTLKVDHVKVWAL